MSVLLLDGPVAGPFQVPDKLLLSGIYGDLYFAAPTRSRHRRCSKRAPLPERPGPLGRPGPEHPAGLPRPLDPLSPLGPGAGARPARGPGGRPMRLPGPLGGGQQTHGHHPAGPGGHHQGRRSGGVAQARRPRRRGDDAGTGPDPPGDPETGGAPPRRGPGGDQGHRLHPLPHPGRSYRDDGIRAAAWSTSPWPPSCATGC